MTSRFSITGVITTMSPLHITSAGGETRIGLNGGDPEPGSKGFILAKTTRMRLAVSPTVSVIGEEGRPAAGAYTDVPCIPANSIRGSLRRMAAREVMEAIKNQKEKLTVNGYNVLMCGAATGNPDKVNPTVDEMLRASAHPYFGLFGGGPRMMRSRLRVDTALAVTERSVAYVGDDFKAAMNGVNVTENAWLRRNDDSLKLVDPEYQRSIISDYVEAMTTYQESLAKKKATSKAKAEGIVLESTEAEEGRGLESFNALEYVVPGTHFALRLDIDGTEAQAGLALSAIQGLVRTNKLGGGGRRGFGRFMLQTVRLTENDVRSVISNRLTENDVSFVGRGAELIAAWEQARKSISAAEIEGFSRPTPVDPPKSKAPKAAKAAVAAEEEA